MDGTLTSRGNIAPQAVEAIAQARRNGLAIVLTTGRIGAELKAEFPQIADQVDALVLENGGVILIDGQTHALAPPVGGARRGGYVLSSFAPASLPAKEVDSSDVVLSLTDPDAATDIGSRQRATIRLGAQPTRPFTIADRETAHVRHRHKYADIRLPPERRFFFHTTDGQPIAPAATMHDFSTAVKHIDQHALEYHLERGDFSHWLDGTIADKQLAMKVAAWEDELEARRAVDLERIRDQLAQAVEERYLPAQS